MDEIDSIYQLKQVIAQFKLQFHQQNIFEIDPSFDEIQ